VRVTTDEAPLGDEALMRAVQRGSREAFEALFERYRDALWRFFRRRVPDADRAEELTHDAFVAILQGTTRYRGDGAFRSYVFGIAYNILLADRRKASFRRSSPLGADPPAAAATDPDIELWVRGALEQLDADDREILMLREYDQLSYDEIAHVRSMPLNTVRSRLFRARMALKAALESRVDGEVKVSHGGR
jgi:RNA polymerase sigma-70 factor, ECF subfamily